MFVRLKLTSMFRVLTGIKKSLIALDAAYKTHASGEKKAKIRLY